MRECDKQEKRISKGLGGKRQIGSGATPFLKGDVMVDDLLIECKTKDKPSKSITIKKEWFTKSKEEAFSMQKEGAILVFSFGDGEDYVAEDYNSFKTHYEAYRKLLDIEAIIDKAKYLKGLKGLTDELKDIEEVLNRC